MAKRFTDTTKWARKNYRLLPPKLKCAWTYVTDTCDHAGIWHPDFDLMSFQIGEQVTEEEFLEAFDKVIKLPNGAFFFPQFILFQYGANLEPTNNATKKVISTLKAYNIEITGLQIKPLPSPSSGADEVLMKGSLGAQEEEEDKEEEEEKEKDQKEEEKKETEERDRGAVDFFVELIQQFAKTELKPRALIPTLLRPNEIEACAIARNKNPDRAYWVKVLTKARESPFLCGKKGKFRFTLQFLLKPEVPERILAGTYDGFEDGDEPVSSVLEDLEKWSKSSSASK